jgi:hypothetical protein
MNSKRNLDSKASGSGTPPSKKRKALTIEEKLKILNKIADGQKINNIARDMNVNHSTICTIKLNAKKIKDCAKIVCSKTASKIIRPRDAFLDKLERILNIWLCDQRHKGAMLSTEIIQTKALSLYADLKNKSADQEEVPKFIASNGWFTGFKKR